MAIRFAVSWQGKKKVRQPLSLACLFAWSWHVSDTRTHGAVDKVARRWKVSKLRSLRGDDTNGCWWIPLEGGIKGDRSGPGEQCVETDEIHAAGNSRCLFSEPWNGMPIGGKVLN
jgi:hypothetical protein